MDRIFKICITFKFSDFVVRSLLLADGPNGIGHKICAFFSAIQPIDFNTFYTVVILKNEGISIHTSMSKLRMAEIESESNNAMAESIILSKV